MINFKTTLAAAAMLALPMAANAVTVPHSIDLSQNPFTGSAKVQAGETIVFEFTVTERMKVYDIALSGSGNVAGARWQMTNPDLPLSGGTSAFEMAYPSGVLQFIPGSYVYQPGDVFTIQFTQPTTNNAASYTAAFSMAEVPVPAAGLLLLSALGGAAVLRRRKPVSA